MKDFTELMDLGEVKTFSVKKETVETLESERAIVHYISTPDKDWGGDIVDPKGMNDSMFKKHGTVFYNHNYNLPIAKNMWIKKKDEGVLVKTVFGKTMFADDTYMLHKDGIISTWSIGWQPTFKNGKMLENAITYDQKKDITYINKWDLIEYSSAPLAMNPSALDQMKTMVKSQFAKSIIENAEIDMTVKEELEAMKKEMAELLELKSQYETLSQRIEDYEGNFTNLSDEMLELTKTLELNKKRIKDTVLEIVVDKHKKSVEDIKKDAVDGAIRNVLGK